MTRRPTRANEPTNVSTMTATGRAYRPDLDRPRNVIIASTDAEGRMWANLLRSHPDVGPDPLIVTPRSRDRVRGVTVGRILHTPSVLTDRHYDETLAMCEIGQESTVDLLGRLRIDAQHPHKGPNDTDASMLLAAAERIEGGYVAGGSNTSQTVARVLRAVADAIA